MYENDIPLSDKNSNFLQNFLEILEKETCDETVEIIRINFFMNCFESPIPTKEQERILYDAKTDEEWRQACKEIGIPTYVEIIGDETIGEYALRAFHSLQCKEDAERKRREYHGLKEYMAALNKIKIMHQNQEFKKILMSALNELSCIERYEIYLSTVESYLSKYLHKREGKRGKKIHSLDQVNFQNFVYQVAKLYEKLSGKKFTVDRYKNQESLYMPQTKGMDFVWVACDWLHDFFHDETEEKYTDKNIMYACEEARTRLRKYPDETS